MTIIRSLVCALACAAPAHAAPLEAERGADALEKLVAEHEEGDPWRVLAYAERFEALPEAAGPRLAEVLRRAGRARLRIGDDLGAERDFKRASELLPRDPELPGLLAAAKRSRPSPEAAAFARRAAEADGLSAGARARTLRLAAEISADAGERAAAEQDLERSLALVPDDLDALDAAARLAGGERGLAYARRAENAALAQPDWLKSSAERFVARLWLALGRPERAASLSARAAGRETADVAALGLLSRVRSALSPADLAALKRPAPRARKEVLPPESELRRALERDPEDARALLALAELERRRGRAGEAARLAASLQPLVIRAPVWQQAAAYRALAALWTSLGDEARTVVCLGRAVEAENDSAEAREELLRRSVDPDDQKSALAYIYAAAAQHRLDLGDERTASALAGRALAVDPGHGWALRLKTELAKRPSARK